MRNERAEVESPALEIPEAGQYLFDLYFDASRAVSRIRDGLCARIDPTQWAAYFGLMKIEIRPWEYECLIAMDTEFCKETQSEINAIGEKRRAEMDKQGRGRR